MTNLTVVIDEHVLRAARIKALQQGTSVNAICREAIERFAADTIDDADVMRELRALSHKISASTKGTGGAQWPGRAALYEVDAAGRGGLHLTHGRG